MPNQYTEPYKQLEIAWLKENINKYPNWESFINAYNSTFPNNQKRPETLRSYCNRALHLYISGSSKPKQKRYTKEQDQWLIENIKNYSFEELTREFNKTFNESRTLSSISQRCNTNLNIYNEREVFLKNKSKLIGYERTNKDGYTFVKVRHTKVKNYRANYKKDKLWECNFIPKAQFVYESYYNIKIKYNERVIFLDKNIQNFNIDNLYCVDARINAEMCRWNMYSTDKELTKTRIKILELKHVLQGNKEYAENTIRERTKA